MNDKEYTFDESSLLVSKTDIKGHISYANREFIDICGFSEKELLGKPHNIVRHPEMPSVIFKWLWEFLQKGEEINAYVKNRVKKGGYYWVYANVTPSMDTDGKIIGFHSTRRKPTAEALHIIEPLYKRLLDAEQEGGVQSSEKIMMAMLAEKGVSYEEFIVSI